MQVSLLVNAQSWVANLVASACTGSGIDLVLLALMKLECKM